MGDLIYDVHNDEWLSRLIKRMRMTPIIAALLVLILNLASDLTAAAYFNAWRPSTTSRGLSTEPTSWLYDFLLQPLILGYFCWLQTSIKRTIEQLISKRIVQSEAHSRTILIKLKSWLHLKILPYGAAFISVLFTGWFILAFTKTLPAPSASWITTHSGIVWGRALVVFVLFYAFVIGLYDVIVFIVALNSYISHANFRVRPFDPDQAGGLGSIGRFSANLGYFVGVLGLIISLSIIQDPAGLLRDYALIIEIGLYIFLAPVVFFFPLIGAHNAMTAYRDGLLLILSDRFDPALMSITSLELVESKTIDSLLSVVHQAETERAIIGQFPTWPFNLANLRKFFGLVLSPLLPGVISLVAKVALKI